MSALQIPGILDKIISLTSERDSGALESSLAQTLQILANVTSTTIYSVGAINRAKHALVNNQPESKTIPAKMVEPLLSSLSLSKVISLTWETGKNLTLYPLNCSQKQALAVIVIEESQTSNHALAMQIVTIYHHFISLMHENEHDTLTGLLNRKTFNLRINDIMSDLQDQNDKQVVGQSSYLAIFDIDHFKQINDTHGHLIGDEVLRLFAQQMRKNFRDKDLLFRFGGEEFVGIFQCIDDDTMYQILNRFREVTAQFNFPQIGQITISGGFTKINPLARSSKIMNRADIALFHAKHDGRNKVCMYEQLITSGALIEKEDNNGELALF